MAVGGRGYAQRPLRFLIAAVVCLLVVSGSSSAGGPAAVEGGGRADVEGRWFAPTSPWNTRIPASTPIVRQSWAWMRALNDTIAHININRTAWTPTILIARGSVPRGTVKLPNGWRLSDVPLSPRFAPSSDSDRHAVVIDTVRGRMYDFFGLGPDPQGGWSAQAGVVMRLWGSGWYNGRYCKQQLCGPWGARSSSAALGGGLIRASEVKAGVIPHALACAAPKHLIGPPVSPATTSDGSGGGGAIPMGSRLQLDPNVSVSSMGLEPGEEMIARALQTYGAYIVESSSSFACYARNVAHLQSNPYPASWSNGITESLLANMRVVAAPAPPQYDTRAVFGQPSRRPASS